MKAKMKAKKMQAKMMVYREDDDVDEDKDGSK